MQITPEMTLESEDEWGKEDTAAVGLETLGKDLPKVLAVPFIINHSRTWERHPRRAQHAVRKR